VTIAVQNVSRIEMALPHSGAASRVAVSLPSWRRSTAADRSEPSIPSWQRRCHVRHGFHDSLRLTKSLY
jgi:hypothetical protein